MATEDVLASWELPQIPQVLQTVKEAFPTLEVFPPENERFAAFTHFQRRDLRVVILGQDPYIHLGEAHGLAFSVPNGCKMPPSLRNIFKELERAYGVKRTATDLTDWARQGVLLLNTALTVREGCSGSHSKLWFPYMHHFMKRLGEESTGVVFMLWGNHAQSYRHLINEEANLVLTWTHPSPLSRKSFVGCDHFETANRYLQGRGKERITWC